MFRLRTLISKFLNVKALITHSWKDVRLFLRVIVAPMGWDRGTQARCVTIKLTLAICGCPQRRKKISQWSSRADPRFRADSEFLAFTRLEYKLKTSPFKSWAAKYKIWAKLLSTDSARQNTFSSLTFDRIRSLRDFSIGLKAWFHSNIFIT